MYYCFGCKKVFKEPNIYEERHGLDTPPYERILVCPKCYSDNFKEYDIKIEKMDVLDRVLPSIAALNRFNANLKDVFGDKFFNQDFYDANGLLNELVSDMFCYINTDVQRKILNMVSEKDIDIVLMLLRD